MEWNIESTLSDLGIDFQFYRNTKNKKTFRNVTTIQQGKQEDLCYCSFDGEEAISLISQSRAGIILCKRSLEEFIDQYYIGHKNDAQAQRCSIILVDNPRAAFIKIINKIYNSDKKGVGISSTAFLLHIIDADPSL